MNASFAYPVQAFREHVTGLEAAISACLAVPDHKPVHRLRTESRRVEALLILLESLPDLPKHRNEARAVRRTVKQLRRAAGEVRDLDVHRKLLETFAEVEADQSATDHDAGTTPKKESGGADLPGRPGPGSDTTGGVPIELHDKEVSQASLRGPALDLRHHLGKKRDRAARHLQTVLGRKQVKAAAATELLLEILEPVKDMAVPAENLLHVAWAVLTRDDLLHPGQIDSLDDNELHTVRKAAKKARYVVEILPENAAATAAAQRLEALQESGGQWHDALEIAQAARRYLGRDHVLTVAYRADRDHKLAAYRQALHSSMEAAPDGAGSALRGATQPKRPGKARTSTSSKLPTSSKSAPPRVERQMSSRPATRIRPAAAAGSRH